MTSGFSDKLYSPGTTLCALTCPPFLSGPAPALTSLGFCLPALVLVCHPAPVATLTCHLLTRVPECAARRSGGPFRWSDLVWAVLCRDVTSDERMRALTPVWKRLEDSCYELTSCMNHTVPDQDQHCARSA